VKRSDWIIFIVAAAATLGGAAWYARRAMAGAPGFVPLGFQWDPQRRQYTKLSAGGTVEYLGADHSGQYPDF